MIRVVADHRIPFLEGALEPVARVEYLPGSEIRKKHLVDADALIIRTRTECDKELLEGTSVKFIASATIGYDHINVDYCRDAGIGWANAPGCNSSSVRQYMVSVLLHLAHQRNFDLENRCLGIIGVGNVGSKVARAARALGMKVLLNDPPRARREGEEAFVSLDRIMRESDVVTLHVPLNRGGQDNTYHLADEAFIKKLKPGAILVNTSRGSVVRQESLVAAIRNGKISAAVLDVFEGEPRVNGELLDLLTLATPHIAGYSLDGKANGTGMAVRAVSRFFGLGLDDWQPGELPVPERPVLHGDPSAMGRQELLWELYRQTYDVSVDDRRLRNDPEAFEQQRGTYPFRREPVAYSVRLFRGNPELVSSLEELGFSV
jgi:erythronate-4-phosphate dehydrogenase